MKLKLFFVLIFSWMVSIPVFSQQTAAWFVYLKGKQLPANAFVAGNESNGTQLFISRIPHNNGYFPGKANLSSKKAYFSYGGKEIEKTDIFEIFTGDGVWVKFTGNIPLGAIRSGYDIDGTPLYIIQAKHANGIHPGRIDEKFNAFIPYGGKEIRVKDFNILVAKEIPGYLSKFRWKEEHLRGSISIRQQYSLSGIEGKCNLYSNKIGGGLENILADSKTKGVKQSDLTDKGVKEFLDKILSRKNPKLEVQKIISNKQGGIHSWGTPYLWGSYRYKDKDYERTLYPKGGVIEYRPVEATVDVIAKNGVPTYNPDDLNSNFRYLTASNGQLPVMQLDAEMPASIAFTFQRPGKSEMNKPIVVKAVVYSSFDLFASEEIVSAVEPAIHLGEGVYQVRISVPSTGKTGNFPVYISVGYISDGKLRSTNEDSIVKDLTFESHFGSFWLVLKNDQTGNELENLKSALSENRAFANLSTGVQNFNGKKIAVFDIETSGASPVIPDGVDGVLVRSKTPDSLSDVETKIQIPAVWKIVLDPTIADIAGAAEIFSNAYSYLSSFTDAYKDTMLQNAGFAGKDIDVVRVLRDNKGNRVYEIEKSVIIERKLANGKTVLNKNRTKIPSKSDEVAASKITRYTSAAKTAMGVLSIGTVAYSASGQLAFAYKNGDYVELGFVAAETGFKIVNQTLQLSKYSKTSGASAIAYIDAGMGLLRAGYALYQFNKATSSYERQAKGQECASLALNSGLAILTVAFPPASVIDPTFRATVTVLNKLIPGSKSNKDLTDAALSDVGTALTFMGSYLMTGITKEISEQALKQGIDDCKSRTSRSIFVTPK